MLDNRTLILYSTVDGHTRLICERLKQVLESSGKAVTLLCLEDNADLDVQPFDKVVIGASIRYGKHRPQVIRFINERTAQLNARSGALFSVNVVARKPQKNAPDTNPYMRKLLRQIAWRPRQLAVFAGKIDYPRYDFLDRAVIRFIMLLTRGPTNPQAVVDFTDWNAVESFGKAIAT